VSAVAFRMADACVAVDGDEVDLARVGELLRPYARQGPPDEVRPDWMIHFESARSRNAGPLVAAGDGWLRVHVDRDDQVLAFQVIRALLVNTSLAIRAPLHAAVLSGPGGGVVFTGPKGAGKTSFVSAVLRNVSNVDFVTNDKALVAPVCGDVLGLPYAVALGREGRRRTVELDGVPSRDAGVKDLIWPADFARALRSHVSPSCRPTVVVVCEADFSVDTVEVLSDVRPSERRRLLSTEMANFGEAMLPRFLLGQAAPERNGADVRIGLPSAWLELPWLRCRGNPWAMGPDVAQTLVAHTPDRT
jgi:hypothetical protein